MNKLFVGIVLALVVIFIVVAMILLFRVSMVQGAEPLPCGFQRLADVCMQYPPDENGTKIKDLEIIDETGIWEVTMGYHEGDFVGVVLYRKDDPETYPPIAIIYDIKKAYAFRSEIKGGSQERLTKEQACSMMETFWEVYDSHIKEI